MKFDKNTTIGEAVTSDERVAPILMGFGMHCFGCPMSQMETLEEAGIAHGVDVDFMIEKLNELFDDNEKEKRDSVNDEEDDDIPDENFGGEDSDGGDE